MNKIITNILDNSVIICENNYKMKLLTEMMQDHLFLHVKFYTKKEFMQEFTFKYDERSIAYLVSKYNLKVTIAKMYLKNMLVIKDDVKYKNSKLINLQKLKKELQEQGLLNVNPTFKNYLNNFHLYYAEYLFLDSYEKEIFNKLNIKPINYLNTYEHKKVYEFTSSEEEILFVVKKISNLLEQGISINNIKLMNVNKEYYNDLKRIFAFYNIPIKIPITNSLFSHPVTQKFLTNLTISLNDAYLSIQNDNSNIVNRIITICNKYVFVSDINILRKLLINEFKNTNIATYNLKNYVEIIDIDDLVTDKDYVFLMNFNNGEIPKIIKDEDYITDNIKEEVNMLPTYKINQEIKINIINKIKHIKNLFISYKLQDSKNVYYPSVLINELNLEKEIYKDDILLSYSSLNDKLQLAKLYDNYYTYGTYNSNINIYQNSLEDICYGKYDNKFKDIDNNLLQDFMHNKLTLSYSSLNTYNKCAFRYYIQNILKLDIFEENFEAFIGSLFHDVLEKCLNSNKNVLEEINNFILKSGKVLNAKEKFFVKKIEEDINFVIKTVKEQQEYMSLDNTIYEKEIVINKDSNWRVTFKGIIDKILYSNSDGKINVAVIDYKTGNVDIDLKYLPDGFGMQLPTYLYLIKNSHLFSDVSFIGFYLQYILNTEIPRKLGESYLEQKKDSLKLVGYSTSDIKRLKTLDSTYENSKLIKSMKVKADGEFNAWAKVLSDEDINKIITLTENNIDNAISKIQSGDFTINPKYIGYEKNVGCEYCKYRDICFKTEKDRVILEERKDLSFLGGDKDAKVD